MHLLQLNLADGYRWGLDHFRFRLALKLDTDALFIAPGAIREALDFSSDNPSAGCFGVLDRGPTGGRRDLGPHVRTLTRQRMNLVKPFFAETYDAAIERGWVVGRHVFGPAAFYTYPCLTMLRRAGALDIPPYSEHQHTAEDVWFSMATVAGGLDLREFGAPFGSLALTWRDLPASPESLRNSSAKIVHSVDKGPRATSARSYFRSHRLPS